MDDQRTNIDNENTTEQGGGQQEGAGGLVGVVVIILIIVLGGLYFLNQRVDNVEEGETGNEIRQQQDDAVLDLQTQGSSDEVSDIEADLDLTELENLDEELGNIDSELNF